MEITISPRIVTQEEDVSQFDSLDDILYLKSTEETLQSDSFDAPLAIDLICTVVFIIWNLIGNSCVIRIYSKRKPLTTGYSFMIYLAILDLISCVLLLIMPFGSFLVKIKINDEFVFTKALFSGFVFFVFNYLAVLVTFALDRVIAVFRPHEYKNASKQKMAYGLGMLTLISLLLAVAIFSQDVNVTNGIIRPIFALILIIGLIVISISYIAILFKLRKQRVHVNSTIGRATHTGKSNTQSYVNRLSVFRFLNNLKHHLRILNLNVIVMILAKIYLKGNLLFVS